MLKTAVYRKINHACLFIILFLFPLTSHSLEWLEKFEDYVDQNFERSSMPGMAMAVIVNDEVMFKRTYGYKSFDTLELIDKQTNFRIASLSKGFSAALIMKLVSEKLLKLEDPCTKYLPKEYSKFSDVSIRNLLSHTTGFYQYSCDNEVYAGKDEAELAKCLAKLQKVCQPGDCYHYQNYLFSFIAPIVHEVTGNTFNEMLRHKILKPLSMNRTFLTSQQWRDTKNKALGHDKVDAQLQPFDSADYYDQILPAGGLSSNIEDLTRWLQFIMNGSDKVLTLQQLSPLYFPNIQTRQELDRFDAEWRKERLNSADYGLGWRLYSYANEEMISHSGVLKGYSAWIAFLPEYKTGIVLLANSSTEDLAMYAARFFDLYLNLPERDWVEIKKRRI